MTPLLAIALEAAVPLHIHQLQAQGGPTAWDRSQAREMGALLGEKGGVLLFGSRETGEAAALFNRLAQTLAVLAYCPGVRMATAWYKDVGCFSTYEERQQW